jgi:hypothetical protein
LGLIVHVAKVTSVVKEIHVVKSVG